MDDFFPRCQHLTLNGARCTAPALNDKEFCYTHHYRRLRRARNRQPCLPDTRDVAGPLVTFVYMDDLASVMDNINSIAQAFAEHSIDHRQLGSLTYLMNTALKTVDRMSKLEKPRPEDMPTVVAHDDLDEPIATPDREGDRSQKTEDSQPQPSPEPIAATDACHPDAELREAEGSAVALSESSLSDQDPHIADDHASQPTEHAPPILLRNSTMPPGTRLRAGSTASRSAASTPGSFPNPLPPPNRPRILPAARLELNAAAEPEPVLARRTPSAERRFASSLPGLSERYTLYPEPSFFQ